MAIILANEKCKKCGKEIWLSSDSNCLYYAQNHHEEYKEDLCYTCF